MTTIVALSTTYAGAQQPGKPDDIGAPKASAQPNKLFSRQQIERALNSPVEVDFADQPLSDCMETFGELHGINIVIARSSLNEEGISSDTPISLSLHDVTFRFALTAMLRPIELTAVIDDEVLKITTTIAAETILKTRVYDLTKILDVPATAIDVDSLVNAIVGCIGPDTWEDVGGPGTIAAKFAVPQNPPADANAEVPAKPVLPGVIVIRQTEDIHRQIQKLLEDIKRQYAPVAEKPGALTLSEKNRRAIRHALSQPITASYVDRPLRDVIRELGTKYKINTLIDTAALNDEGISPDTPITVRVKGIALRNFLRLILRPIELTAVLDDEALTITTGIAAEAMLVVEVYNVSDFPLRGNYRGLIDTLVTTVAPATWEKAGGAGVIAPCEIGIPFPDEAAAEPKPKFQLLIIRQTGESQRKVASLLEKLRRAHQ